MREFNDTVVRHILTQRDSSTSLELWNQLWKAYEQNGPEGVIEAIESFIELPGANKEDQS